MSGKWLPLLVVLIALGCTGMGKTMAAGEAPRMAKEELKALLGSPDIIVIDVRYGKDWTESERKIAGAVREDPKKFDLWKGRYPREKTLVLYCS